LLGGLVGIALGLFPVLARPDLLTTRLFFLGQLGLAVNFGFLASDAYLVHHLPRWGFLGAGLLIGTMLNLAFIMPEVREPLRSHPRATLAAIYGTAVIVMVLLATRSPLALTMLAALGNAALTFQSRKYGMAGGGAGEPLGRRGARVVLASLLALLAAAGLFVAGNLGWIAFQLPVAAFLIPLWVCAALLVYAMLELNLFDLGGVVQRGLTAGILAIGAVAVYLALFLALERLVDVTSAWAVAGLVAAVAVRVVLTVAPVRGAVEGVIERTLFPGQRAARELIYAASRELARLREVADLGRFLRESAAPAVAASTMRLVWGSRDGPVTEVAPSETGAALVLARGDPLTALLARGAAAPFESRTAGANGAAMRSAAERGRQLGVHLVAPLPPSASHVGGFLLGARTDGRLYTREDERLLETLAAQTAVALDNARAWEE